jgi:hypothetical protein
LVRLVLNLQIALGNMDNLQYWFFQSTNSGCLSSVCVCMCVGCVCVFSLLFFNQCTIVFLIEIFHLFS